MPEATFKCLRCGREFIAPYNEEPQERACPECRSNSVRRIKEPEKGESPQDNRNR